MRKTFIYFFVCVIGIFASSCAGVLIKAEYLTDYQKNNYREIDYTDGEYGGLIEDMAELGREIKDLKSPVPEGTRLKLLEKAGALQERYSVFLKASAYFDRENYAVIVPAKSVLHIKLKTYCLALDAACPVSKEQYILTAGGPENAPMLLEIMKYTNTKEKTQHSLKQSLIWNLNNQVAFEDLPADQKILLLKADPAAYLKANSHLKEKGIKFIKGLIPGAPEIERAASFIKGKVHEYEEYEKAMMKLRSRIALPEDAGPIKADGYEGLYTIVKTNGYTDAEVYFINTSAGTVTVHSYFKPVRGDVQPLAFDLPEHLDEQALKDAMGKLLSGIIDFSAGGIKPGDRKTIEENPDRLVDLIKAGFDKEDAYTWTEKLYGGNGADDESDAFRHAFWNAIMVRDVGDFGETIASNHELNDPGTPGSNDMDLWNNRIGREIGKELSEKGAQDNSAYAEEVKKQMGRLMKSPGEKK